MAGLLPRVREVAEKALEVHVPIRDGTLRPHTTPNPNPLTLRAAKGEEYELRENQVEALRAWRQNRGMILHAATNSGKTEVALCAMHEAWPARCLYLTHRTNLLRQTAERVERVLNEPAGVVGDGDWSPERVSCSTVQTIDSLLRDPKRKGRALEFLGEQDFIVWDECHRAPRGQFWRIARALCDQAPKAAGRSYGPYWSLAMSGTIDTGCPVTNRRLEALAGPVSHVISNAEQIEAGYSARGHVVVLELPKAAPPGAFKMKRRDALRPYVYGGERRTRLFAQCAAVLRELRLPFLAITESVQHHLPEMERVFAAEGLRAPVVSGQVSTDRRLQLIRSLSSGNLDGILASTIFDEGMDVPDVYAVLDLGTWKNPRARLQRFGRALRRKSVWNHALYVIAGDWWNEDLSKVSLATIELLEKEEAFGFSFVSSAEEFRGAIPLAAEALVSGEEKAPGG